MKSLTLTAIVLTVCFAVGSTSATAMSFDKRGGGGNCGTCQWVAASGEITTSTAAEFETFAAGLDQFDKIVYLSSPGGSVFAAMQLGRAFRKRGMTTVVGKSIKPPGYDGFDAIEPSECMSACVLAFAGGKSRYYRSRFGAIYSNSDRNASDKNALGLHQFYTMAGESPEERSMTAETAKAFGIEGAQVVMGVEMAYLAEMGVDPLLLSLASTTKPGDIYTLTEAEAVHFKLAMPQDLQPEWQLKFRGQALAAEGQGSFEGDEYRVSLWCPSHSKRRLLLGISFKLHTGFGEDRVRPYQYYITRGIIPDRNPISFEGFYRKGQVIGLNFAVDGPALDLLQSGATFGLVSDAPHGDQILPWGTMQLDPRVVPILLKTCEG
jgi:hypothetical protein